MISSPQEIEQTAMNIANWIIYNGKPFSLPADNGKHVLLAVITEEQFMMINSPQPPEGMPITDKKSKKE